MVGVPDLWGDRRGVVFELRVRVVAAIHHDPAECEVNEIRALEIAPRPVIAEWCDPRRYQRWKARAERRAVEPQRLVQGSAAGVEQHIGAGQQAKQLLARSRLAQIQHDRFLIAVVVPEIKRALRARLVIEKRADPSRRTAFGRFDLDQFGAEPGEQQPGIFGAFVGDLDDPQAGEHAGTGIAHHLTWSGGDRVYLRHGVSSSRSSVRTLAGRLFG